MQAASFKFLAVSALSFAAAAASISIRAEPYQGVSTVGSTLSRQDVMSGAHEAARAGNIYGQQAAAGLSPTPAVSMARAEVRRDAVAIARAGNPYGDAASAGVGSQSADPLDALASARRASLTPTLN